MKYFSILKLYLIPLILLVFNWFNNFIQTSSTGGLSQGIYLLSSTQKNSNPNDESDCLMSLKDAEANRLTLITGHIKVNGVSDLPSDAKVIVTNNKSEALIGVYKPRKKDGKFILILATGNEYHIVYSVLNYKYEENIFISEMSAYQRTNESIQLQDVVFWKPLE